MAVDPEQTTEEVEEVLSNLEEKFPELLPREDMITFLQEAQFHANGIVCQSIFLSLYQGTFFVSNYQEIPTLYIMYIPSNCVVIAFKVNGYARFL